jgi:hypothetical protein
MRREKETAAVGFFNFFMVFVCSWQGNPGTETMGRRSRAAGSLYLWLYWLDPFVWNYNQLKICLDNSCLSATLATSRRAWSKTECLLDRRGRETAEKRKRNEKWKQRERTKQRERRVV